LQSEFTGPTGDIGNTGGTGPAGGAGINSGSVSVNFAATSGLQTINAPTGVSFSSYSTMWLGGFDNTGGSLTFQLASISLNVNAGTWRVTMKAVNPDGDDITVYYYYL
jgi:hypothetical protein